MKRMSLLSVAMVVVLTLSGRPVQAQKLGQTIVDTIPYRVSANWDESNVDEPFLQLDPGWIIVGVKDERSVDFGRTGFSASYLAQNGHFASNFEVESKFKELSDHMFKVGNISGQRRAQDEKNRWLSSRSNVTTSNATVKLRIQASGNGNFVDRKGGRIAGNFLVTKRYVGTSRDLDQTIAGLKLSAEPPPQQGVGWNRWNYRNGAFIRTQGNQWIELQNGKQIARFVETGRGPAEIILFDASRSLQVSLTANKMHWKLQGNSQWNYLYDGTPSN